MVTKNRAIRDFMITIPVTADENASLATAVRLIRHYNIRHLPITHEGKLSGIVFARDLEAVLKVHEVDQEEESIQLIINRHPVHVEPDAPLKEVLDEMVHKKYEAVIVQDAGKILGVFTVIDALKILRDLL